MSKERREYLLYMKNKYLTKCFCFTMISAMVLSAPTVSFASETGQAFESEDRIEDGFGDSSNMTPVVTIVPEESKPSPTPTPTPQPEATENPAPTPGDVETPTPTPEEAETPSPAPGEETPTPTPGEVETPTPTPGETPSPTPGEETPTPTPGETPSPTPGEETPTPTPGETPSPTPGEETPTPTPGETPSPTPGEETPTPGVTETPTLTPTPAPTSEEKVQDLINRIDALHKTTLTIESKPEIEALRATYDSFTAEEKAKVTNYNLLVSMEKIMDKLGTEAAQPGEEDFVDGSKVDVVNGMPMYYTNMVSNLHAGKEFYLNSLQENYQLTFSEDFASVMDEIEKEYKAKNGLTDASDMTGGVTTSADSLLVRNWQDILAIYVYEQNQQGAESYTLDASSKDALAAIFAEMNPVIRDKESITKVTYGNYHINYYIKKNSIPKSERAVLKKYLETDCKLLCATVTAAKGFVRESVGDDVSEERVNVIAAAYSLVGKVGYFWGGKSTVIGEDPSWGSVSQVTAEGSKSTGTLRAYGLDCSGFVTWSVINGYENQAMIASVGSGTSDQWVKANVVSEADAQPGDLVFQRGPEAGSDNHVGILVGKTDAGDWIAVHCSSSKNGVTVGEAYSASFRYIRQPSFYPTDEQVAAMEASGSAVSDQPYFASGVTVSNSLQELIQSNLSAFGDMDTITVDAEGNAEIPPSNVYVTNGLQGIFESEESIFSGVNYADAVEVSDYSSDPADTEGTAADENSGFTGITVTNSLQELLSSTIGIQQ